MALSDADKLAWALGWALDRWNQVEELVCSIFVAAMEPANISVVSDAYYSALSFRAKLGMTNAALKRALRGSPALLDEWSALRKKIEASSRLRNELAHGRIQGLNMENCRGWFWLPFLAPHRYADLVLVGGGKQFLADPEKPTRLTADQIMERSEAFIQLRDEITRYLERLRSGRPPNPT